MCSSKFEGTLRQILQPNCKISKGEENESTCRKPTTFGTQLTDQFQLLDFLLLALPLINPSHYWALISFLTVKYNFLAPFRATKKLNEEKFIRVNIIFKIESTILSECLLERLCYTMLVTYHACDVVKFRQTVERDDQLLKIRQVVDVF